MDLNDHHSQDKRTRSDVVIIITKEAIEHDVTMAELLSSFGSPITGSISILSLNSKLSSSLSLPIAVFSFGWTSFVLLCAPVK